MKGDYIIFVFLSQIMCTTFCSRCMRQMTPFRCRKAELSTLAKLAIYLVEPRDESRERAQNFGLDPTDGVGPRSEESDENEYFILKRRSRHMLEAQMFDGSLHERKIIDGDTTQSTGSFLSANRESRGLGSRAAAARERRRQRRQGATNSLETSSLAIASVVSAQGYSGGDGQIMAEQAPTAPSEKALQSGDQQSEHWHWPLHNSSVSLGPSGLLPVFLKFHKVGGTTVASCLRDREEAGDLGLRNYWCCDPLWAEARS